MQNEHALVYTFLSLYLYVNQPQIHRNTDIIDTCIIFRSWHVSSISFFIGSCIFIVLLCIFYEYLRVFQRKLDYRIALSLQAKRKGKTQASSSGRNSPEDSEDASLLPGRKLLRTSLTGSVSNMLCAGRLTYYDEPLPEPKFLRSHGH